MAKYYIESYEKEEQTFMQMMNAMPHDGIAANPSEPYILKLKKVWFFGLISSKIDKAIRLPKGFNHKKALYKGREVDKRMLS